MFAAPPSVTAEIFARIPERFHVKGKRSAWGDIYFSEPALPMFLEGPSFDLNGNLWVVDIPWGRLFRITPQGDVTCELEYDGRPNGLKFHKDGRAFIADAKNGLMVFDPTTGTIRPHLDGMLLQRFKGLNDLYFAKSGDIYFTDQGHTGLHDPTGCLYRLSVDGELECLLKNVPSPNGLVLNASETAVFLAVTRNNAVWRVPLAPNHQVIRVGIFIQMSGGIGPDGLAMDEDGNLAVCHVGLGSVWLFSALGEPLLRIRVNSELATTNCAYGGSDNKCLYITTPHTVMVADMPVRGRQMFGQL